MKVLSPDFEVDGLHWGQTLRAGGASVGAYTGLNLAPYVGDDPGHVRTNWARFAAATGWPEHTLATVRQVHGDRVLLVARGGPQPVEADALISLTPGVAVGVFTADCVPVLLACARTRSVAAVHCGWRGAASGLARKAVAELTACAGARPQELRVWIGASIAQCSYEVGEELADRFAARHLARRHRDGHLLLDVAGAVRGDLCAAGVQPGRIEQCPLDTLVETERLYSYRRDGARTGRMLSFVGFRADRV